MDVKICKMFIFTNEICVIKPVLLKSTLQSGPGNEMAEIINPVCNYGTGQARQGLSAPERTTFVTPVLPRSSVIHYRIACRVPYR